MNLLSRSTTRFVAYFMRAYPARTVLLVLLLILAGIAEGVGVLAILPLLEVAAEGGGEPAPGVAGVVAGAVEAVGLTPTFELYLALVVLGISLKGAFMLLAMQQVGYTVSRVGKDLRLALIRALLDSRWAYFTRERAGGFASSLSVEANQAGIAYRNACSMLAALIQVVVYLVAALVVSWRIALLGLVAGGGVVLLLSGLVASTRAAALSRTRLLRSLVSRLVDALQGMKALKAVGRERHLRPVLEGEIEEINVAQERTVTASEGLRAAQEPVLAAMLAVLLYLSLAVGGQPFGAVLIIGFIFYRLASFIGQAQVHYQHIALGESAFWSLRQSIETAAAEREPLAAGGARPELRDEIRLDDVSFRYGEVPVLRDVDLRIPAGAFVVLEGPSGAGKTTLIDLLAGLYHPDCGRVLVDGVPMVEMDLAAWRDRLGYVPQEMFLFHDTLFGNVAMGDERVDREVAREALVAAGAGELVETLPQGLDTVLGERGSGLSGGQRQRIAIARELARRPRLLLLDEVTTALDPATEERVCASLAALRGEVTVVAISHQPAMAEVADMVVRFESGRVVAVRSPERPRDHVLSSR